ncbi:MAG TPA: hypothetical protein PKN05_11375, partial [Syntrophales bacterium]|nr:hypothetical protein [Syntrophales bacterium]
FDSHALPPFIFKQLAQVISFTPPITFFGDLKLRPRKQGQIFILDIVEEPAMAPGRRALPIGRD